MRAAGGTGHPSAATHRTPGLALRCDPTGGLAHRRPRLPLPTVLPALLVFALLVFALLAAPAQGSEGVEAAFLSPADHSRLRAGATVFRPGSATTGAGEGRAWRILEAPAERLLRTVVDWAHYAEFFPFVVESGLEAVVASDAAAREPAGAVRFRQRIDLPFPFADRRFAADAVLGVEGTGADTTWTVGWTLVPGSGDLLESRGAWVLREVAPGRTLVELRLLTDTGVPAALQRRALAETLPWALDGLRQQVGRCRYDLPIHPTCTEAAPSVAPLPVPGGAGAREVPR